MIGSIKGFVSLVKKVNSAIITTHCFLHREVLIGKTLNLDLTQVLKEVIEMVNYIKARPLKSRLLTKLCKEMEANYENLLLPTEAKWLSRGKALSGVYELKEEMLAFFSLERQREFCNSLCDDSWKSKLGYLVDTFDHLNKINSNMQGMNKNLLSSADKMRALQDKLKVWSLRIQEENSDMFFIFRKRITKKWFHRLLNISSLCKTKLKNIFQQCPLKTINGLEIHFYPWIPIVF